MIYAHKTLFAQNCGFATLENFVIIVSNHLGR